jgi:hypothetical protein
MAFVHGKGVVISLGGDDLSPFGTSCEYELKADAHDVTTFGQDTKVFSGGLKESTMKVEGNYDNTASAGPRGIIEPLVGEVSEMIYQPEGSGTGTPMRTWDTLCTSYVETAPVADMIKFTAQFQGSGTVATSTGP